MLWQPPPSAGLGVGRAVVPSFHTLLSALVHAVATGCQGGNEFLGIRDGQSFNAATWNFEPVSWGCCDNPATPARDCNQYLLQGADSHSGLEATTG